MSGEATGTVKRGFGGFPAAGMQFFRSLTRNNRREWFQPRKHIYEEQVRAPMMDLVSALTAQMIRFAPDYIIEPPKAIYRIYRDTRFSNDKTPYKTHIAAIFPRRIPDCISDWDRRRPRIWRCAGHPDWCRNLRASPPTRS